MGTTIGKMVYHIEQLQPQSQSNTIVNEIVSNKNPGLVEYLHVRTQEIMPSNFDGIKFIFNQSLSEQFELNHIVNITNGPENGYRFGTTCTGTTIWHGLKFPTSQSEINPSGQLIASVTHQFNPSMRFLAVVQYRNHLVLPRLTTDWIGNDFSASISASKISATNYPEFVDCAYLKTITDNLALGVRAYYRIAENIGPIAVGLARYETGLFGWSISISPLDIQLCHFLNVKENLRLGFWINGRFSDKSSVAYFGYQFSCLKKEIVVRGMVDSRWNVRSTIEKRLSPLPITLLLSASLNHLNNHFGLGLGVILNK